MNQQTSMISPEQCPGYQGCAAPLCYMDKSLGQACWYPGEPVCRLRQVPKWVKTQRRIAKVLGIAKDADNGLEHYGAFTVKMLESAKRITLKIRGVDLETETEQAWLNKRPSFGVKGGITDITKNLDTLGPMFSVIPSAPGYNSRASDGGMSDFSRPVQPAAAVRPPSPPAKGG